MGLENIRLQVTQTLMRALIINLAAKQSMNVSPLQFVPYSHSPGTFCQVALMSVKVAHYSFHEVQCIRAQLLILLKNVPHGLFFQG